MNELNSLVQVISIKATLGQGFISTFGQSFVRSFRWDDILK